MSEHERLGPPPVEPLSDLAWSRIERGLWSRMDTAPAAYPVVRARRWMWIAAPALAAAAAIVVIAIGTGGDRVQVDGPARLVSGASPTTLSYGDVHVTLDADSAVVMERAKGAMLERGAAWFTVAPRGERAPFVVTAGDAVVRVVGTKFRVARSGEEATVQVEHGTVEVQFRGARTLVHSDEEWTSKEPTIAGPIIVAEIELEPEAPAPTGPAPAVTAPERTPSEPRKPANRPDRSSGIRTAPPAAPAPTQEPAPAVEKPAVEKPAQPDADAAKYHRLEQLEVRNPRAAIEGYLELSRGTSRWAERALFAAARLSADRREGRAKHLLEIYLTRFPGGANVDDARKLLDHIQGANR